MALNEAVERALRIYDKERRHAAPTDVIAQNLGYKSANNGAALAAIASLRSFGLLERAQEGKLAISKDVESYKFAPHEELKSELQIKWLKSPSVFADLLEKYDSGLPSDPTIRFDLIKNGFSPATAESVIAVFKQSVDFAKYFERRGVAANAESEALAASAIPSQSARLSATQVDSVGDREVTEEVGHTSNATHDRIPVRLSGGRRAWLEIPTPFFSADKKRLKAQIDLLLAEDDAENVIAADE
jgi:hypothetical protein